ncbi:MULTISPECIES: bifunctional adenosylcobinamide kinase/adenosylcobinamide-phosphate guanylyltransferase [unclassified Halomonas]|uniref:bifunctional adenosylcobinamide kinase/adenosylcobinamide-phosphate guanylyltransferase n=1 Tax=unclassified Halomonas TaxID=2609666 RepID=UPI002076972F|nr:MULTISPECIES: bifunctional adenosylcobinamide kinase/adenosylcobinamide-phosphate guanylyltransferase [unclassified Halomonas]
MQLFIGGARAGKRDAVKTRFQNAAWWTLAPGQRLADCHSILIPDTPLVINGVLDWVARDGARETDSDRLRAQWREDLAALCRAARACNATIVLIMSEVGRGLVPMAREERRLRDLNGWFSQDAAQHAERVWYVRHGLVQRLGAPISAPSSLAECD